MPEAAQWGGVTEDATLDAFGAGDESVNGESGEDSSENRASSVDSEEETLTPLAPTSSWRPGGDCAACGEHVSRRWRDGDEFTCADCVEW